MQISSNPISPSLVSFYQIEGQSRWERFCERTLRFKSECYVVNADNTLSTRRTPLSCCQIIRNLVVVIFAALLIVPLACMITTKWAARKYLMRHLQVNRLEQEAVQARNKAAIERAEQDRKAAAARQALEAGIIANGAEITAKAKEEAANILGKAVEQAHEVLHAESYGAWFKAPWQVIPKATTEKAPKDSLEDDSKESAEETERWTLKRVAGFDSAPHSGLTISSEIETMVKILLDDGSFIYMHPNLLSDTALGVDSRCWFSKQPTSLDASQDEEEKSKYESASSSTITSTTSGQRTVDRTEWPSKVVKHYCGLISGEDTLKNVSVKELLGLYLLADYESNFKIKRVLAECIDTLRACDVNFHLNLLNACLEDTSIDTMSFFPELLYGLREVDNAKAKLELIKRYFALLSEKQKHLVAQGKRNISIEIQLIRCYFHGFGCERNEQIAKEILEKLRIDMEESLKTKKLSSWDCYSLVASIPLTNESQSALLRRSLDLPQAQWSLTRIDNSLSDADYLKYVQTAADEGIGLAFIRLSRLYLLGNKGVVKDVEKALLFNDLAIAKQTPHAYLHKAMNLVSSRILAHGGVQNWTQVEKLLEKAVESDPKDIYSLLALGKYWCLFATPRNHNRSFEYFQRAAQALPSTDRLVAYAHYWMGIHYQRVWQVSPDNLTDNHFKLAVAGDANADSSDAGINRFLLRQTPAFLFNNQH